MRLIRLNEKKTSVIDANRESFDFLGFAFQMRKSYRSGKVYPHVEPSKRSVERIKARVKELTNRRRTLVPVPVLVQEVNEVLRGWTAYFHHGNSGQVMSRVKHFTEERMRKHLRIRHKVRTRTRGHNRFSTMYLYRCIGLYRVPTYAKWRRQTHALW